MKILLTGGSGLLGRDLLKINSNIICPSHEEMDICNLKELEKAIEKYSPDIIIHSAAIIDNRVIEKYPEKAITTNIIGTGNVSLIALKNKYRLVYISSDYVYKGDRGNYSENDEILPFNDYAWSKLGGECSVKLVKNHLIIRTSFGKSKFDYPQAFENIYTSKDYVDIIAPIVYKVAISDLIGVINVGTKKKTMFEYASKRNSEVLPIKMENGISAKNSSLNLDKLDNFIKSIK